jgi:hypothetical protein
MATTMTRAAARPTTGVRPGVRAAGRAGLVARGAVYLVLAWLALHIAVGERGRQANSQGALATVASRPYGEALLVLLAVGLAGYALWRFSQAALGTVTDGRKAGPRLKSLGRGVVYAGMCATAVEFLAGSPGSSQAAQQSSLTARLMQHSGGRWLVGVAGAVVAVAGVAMVVNGVRRRFAKHLETERMTPATERVVVGLGAAGRVARGVVIMIAGLLVVSAAVTTDPRKSTGLDGALRTLAHESYGPWLLGVIAAGLAAFGLHCLAAAKWERL